MTDKDQAVEAAEREKFEAWAKEQGYQSDELARCAIGIVSPAYFNLNTENTWKAWLARAALARPLEVAAGVITDAEADAALNALSSVLHIDIRHSSKVRAIRAALQAFAASRVPVALGAVPGSKSDEMLSMAIGIIQSARDRGYPYMDNSPIAKFVAEAAEHLKDWHATPSGGAGCSVNAGGEKGSSHLAGSASGGVQAPGPTDAERYQWLREHCDSMSLTPPLTVAKVTGWGLEGWSGDDLNSAINAAILATKGTAEVKS